MSHEWLVATVHHADQKREFAIVRTDDGRFLHLCPRGYRLIGLVPDGEFNFAVEVTNYLPSREIFVPTVGTMVVVDLASIKKKPGARWPHIDTWSSGDHYRNLVAGIEKMPVFELVEVMGIPGHKRSEASKKVVAAGKDRVGLISHAAALAKPKSAPRQICRGVYAPQIEHVLQPASGQ